MGVSALSDQLAAGAVMMGERLGSDDVKRSAQIPADYALRGDDPAQVLGRRRSPGYGWRLAGWPLAGGGQSDCAGA
jgi:hypothetical protein